MKDERSVAVILGSVARTRVGESSIRKILELFWRRVVIVDVITVVALAREDEVSVVDFLVVSCCAPETLVVEGEDGG